MVPDNEGKPASSNMLGGSVAEVPCEDIVEMQGSLAKMQSQLEGVMANLTIATKEAVVASETHDQLKHKPEDIHALADKLENVHTYCKFVQLKLSSFMPRHKGSDEDASANGSLQKRSRSVSHEIARSLGTLSTGLPLDSKLGILTMGDGGDGHGPSANNTAYDLASPGAGDKFEPLKYIRTGDNTKAAYQKPPTQIYMPTPKHGAVNIDGPATGEDAAAPVAPGGILAKYPQSPKKRPNRSRRDRNRARNKVAVAPEPVMQKLMPGDTNKIPEDGYLWRKYGNKPIKTANYKRGYYKCRHFKEVKCNATKIVQQTNNDPSTFSVCYKGEHTCRQQGLSGACGALAGSQADAGATFADQVHTLGDPKSSEDADNDDATLQLDDMEWPPREGEDSDDSSDDQFPSDTGEDAVESGLQSAPPLEKLRPQKPASSPLMEFDSLEPISSVVPNSMFATDENVISAAVGHPTSSPWTVEPVSSSDVDTFTKGKYEPIQTPHDELDQGSLMPPIEDDSAELLKIINGGLWDNNFSDISYWNNLDALSYPEGIF